MKLFLLAFQKILLKCLAFRRDHLITCSKAFKGRYTTDKATSTNSVNSGSEPANTQPADQDDSDMPELTIFNKPQKGIFDEASYDEEVGLKLCKRFVIVLAATVKDSIDLLNGARGGLEQNGMKGIDYDEVFAHVARIEAIIKKFDLASVKTAITPMETNEAMTKMKEADDVDVSVIQNP
ncbi:hypothetical protein Tco_0323971 [Tanacetum coccineum]